MNKERQLKILRTLYSKHYSSDLGRPLSTEDIIKETFPDEENPKFIPDLDYLEQNGLLHGTHASGTVYPLWVQITEYGIDLVDENYSELKRLHNGRRIKILNYLNSKYEEHGSYVDFDIDDIIAKVGLSEIDFDEILQEFDYLGKKGFIKCLGQLGRKHILRAKITMAGISFLEYLQPTQDSQDTLVNPENEERIYESNTQYDVFKDLKNIVQKATKEVFIVDGYTNESLYELYIDSIPKSVPIRILTNNYSDGFLKIGRLIAKQRPLKIHVDDSEVHDRYVFVDDRCWMLGASIKDAGKKPTVLTEIKDRDTLYKIWNPIFHKGKSIV